MNWDFEMNHQYSNTNRANQGFTLIELVVTLSVLSILAVLMTPNLIEKINLRRADLTIQDTQSLLDAARSFRTDTGAWPGGATCTSAISSLETANYFSGFQTTNRYNKPITTRCTSRTFSVTQVTAADWDGYLVNGLEGTVISNVGLHQTTSTIGLPGSEPGLANKLSRVATGNPEDNRMRTTLYMGNQQIEEAGDITFSVPDPTLHADSGSLTLSSENGEVVVAPNQTLTVDDIVIRSRGNRKLSDSIPNFVQIGTYIVKNGWLVNMPACGENGDPKAALRPATMRGGYTVQASQDDMLTGRYGFQYRLIKNASTWTVVAESDGDEADYGLQETLVDVYCYYPD